MDERGEGNTVNMVLVSTKTNKNVSPVWGKDTQNQTVRKWEREH